MASIMVKREEPEGSMGGPVFHPPLYRQRYSEVINISRRIKAKKVIDMGCAECRLLRMLKREPYIEELVGVDYDGVLLRMSEHVVQPLTTDYLMPRDNPLQFTLMQGSIAEPDARLTNFDLFSCVEVIEHLDPEVLERVPLCVFGVLQPRMVVITTPNSEYNVLFPGFSGFRHYDHRFEWTREQFRTWCLRIVSDYPMYSVKLSGVGDPPEGREEVGHCSQMALFTRDDSDICATNTVGTPYNIVCSVDHPYVRPVTPIQKLCSEAEYYLNFLLKSRRDQLLNIDHYYDNNHPSGYDPSDGTEDNVDISGDTLQIKLTDLLSFPKIKALCSSGEEIRDALTLSSLVELNSAGECAVYPMEEGDSSDLSDDEYC